MAGIDEIQMNLCKKMNYKCNECMGNALRNFSGDNPVICAFDVVDDCIAAYIKEKTDEAKTK